MVGTAERSHHQSKAAVDCFIAHDEFPIGDFEHWAVLRPGVPPVIEPGGGDVGVA